MRVTNRPQLQIIVGCINRHLIPRFTNWIPNIVFKRGKIRRNRDWGTLLSADKLFIHLNYKILRGRRS